MESYISVQAFHIHQLLRVNETAGVVFPAAPHTAALASSANSVSLSSQAAVSAVAAIVAALIAGSIAAWSSRYTIKKTLEHQRVQLFNERFATAADKLGHEYAATRLAGLYALAGLADDWEGHRQTCIDVLCGYLRMPYEPDPAASGYREGEREVRRTVVRVIRDHLRQGYSDVSWCNYNFSFEGAIFDCGDLSGARLTGGHVSFHAARFVSGTFYFSRVHFEGAHAWFNMAHFAGADVRFDGVQFLSGRVTFDDVDYTAGNVSFNNVTVSGAEVHWGPFKPPV